MYRILTERKGLGIIKAILEERELDYTMLFGEGSWKGQTEYSVVIEFEGETLEDVWSAARAIQKLNNQQCVFVQEIATKLYKLEREK